MSAAVYNITIDQGSDFAIQFVVKENGVVRDLTGYMARAEMRSPKTPSVVTATFVCTLPDPVQGQVKFALGNAVSKTIEPGFYDWDLEIYTAGDVAVTRLLQGCAEVTKETTKS